MKQGTKVVVLYNHTGHEFDTGEVVERFYLEHDDEDADYGPVFGFRSEVNGEWYMQPDEYEVVQTDNKG